jgi:hypothetical protein
MTKLLLRSIVLIRMPVALFLITCALGNMAHAVPVPEVNPASTTSALTLLAGVGLLVKHRLAAK